MVFATVLIGGCSLTEPTGPITLDQKNYQKPLRSERLYGVSTELTNQQALAQSLYLLGAQYEQRPITEESLVQAFYLYLSAAELNSPIAQAKVAQMFSFGLGTEQNPIEGYKWWYIAAVNNNQQALQYLSTAAQALSEADKTAAETIARSWLSGFSEPPAANDGAN